MIQLMKVLVFKRPAKMLVFIGCMQYSPHMVNELGQNCDMCNTLVS